MESKTYKGTVLIIDDTISIIDMVKTALTNHNYHVLVATSGHAGIKSAKISQPDLILLDILMPEMDGYQTCRLLKSEDDTKGIPVIFMSAISDVFDKIKAFGLGAVDYITKPLNVDELLARVKTQVTLHQIQRQLKDSNLLLGEEVEKRTRQLKQQNEELQAAEEELRASNDALKESNEQLYESQQRYNLLSDLNLEGIAIHRNGVVYDVNKAFCNIFGLTMEEVIGKDPIDRMFPPEDAKIVRTHIINEVDTPYKVRAKKQDGTIMWIEVEARNFMYRNELARTTAFRDITEKENQKQALKTSEERFNLAMNAAQDGLFDWNLIDNTMYYSPGWKKIIGYKDHEIKNTFEEWERLTNKEDATKTMILFNQHINGEIGKLESEIRMLHKEGHWVNILVRGNALFDKSGKATRLIGTHVDITERKKTELALVNSKQIAQENEARYKSLQANMPSGVVVYKPIDNGNDFKVIDFNKAGEEISQLKASKIIGQTLKTLFPGIEKGELFKTLQNVNATGEPFIMAPNLSPNSNNNLDKWTLNQLYKLSNGEIVVLFKDITDSHLTNLINNARLNIANFSHSHTSEQILTKILDEVELLTQSTIGFYHFVNEDNESINLQAWSTNTKGTMCKTKGFKGHYSISQAGVWVDCIHQRKSVIHNNYEMLEHKKGMPEGHANVIRELVVPVFRNKKIVALLGVGNKSTDYTKTDVKIAEQIADFAFENILRKQAEEATLSERNRSLNILQGTNAGTWEWNIQTGETVFNEQWARILGYTLKNISPTNIHTWINNTHPVDVEKRTELLEKHFTGKIDYYEYEARIKHKDGSWIWVLERGKVISHTEDNKPLWMFGTCQDITERKKAEFELKESRNRFQVLYEKAPLSYQSLDAMGNFIDVNPTWEQTFGYSKQEVIGTHFSDYMTPESAKKQLKKFPEFLSCGEVNKVEFDMLTKKKEIITINIYGKVNYDANNKVVKTHCILTDITEQKKAQKELVDSETRFRTIIESANDAIIIADAKSGIIVDVNKKATELLGRSKNEIIGIHQTQLHPEEDKEITKEDFERSKISENIGINEFRVIHASGEIIPVEISPARIKLNNQEFLVGFFRDIRMRREAEKALAESYTKYKTLADYTYDWEYWKAPDGNFIYNSPSCKRITGYSVSEFNNDPNLFNSIICASEKKKWMSHVQKAEAHIACKTPTIVRIKTKKGKIKWINHVCQPVYDSQKNFIGNRGTNRDITQQKNAENELLDSENRFKQLANFTMEGIVIHKNGKIKNVNNALLKMTGYTENELLGKSVLLFVSDYFKNKVTEHIKKLSPKPYEIEITKKNKEKFSAQIFAIDIKLQSENMRVVSIRDITEQKQMQQKILNTIIQTEENERLRIAQELHDGIGPILSTVKLYTQTYINTDNEAFKQKIEPQLITGIDDALAQVSSISNNLSPHVLKDFGLAIAIQKFIKRIQKVNSITIHFNFNKNIELKKEIETTLYRVAIELINNTIKHAKATEISLDFEKINEYIQFVYTDNGIGFDIENNKQHGTGMGLFNITNRIESLFGKVHFERGVEKGIAYNIIIPSVV